MRSDGQTGWNSSHGAMSGTVREQGFVIRSMPLFGFRTRRTIQYYGTSTLAGTSAMGTYVFSANGAFDPDITGTGGQPMGFDQMMVFYNHYTVLRSRIRVVFSNITGGGILSCVALSVSGSSTAVTVVENLLENGDAQFVELGFAGAYGSSATLRRTLDVGKFQGLKFTIDDPNMRGDAASNPTEQVYYHLSAWDPTAATAVSVNFQALIEYDTIFHEPRKGTLSTLFHSRMDESKDPSGPSLGYGGTSDPELALLGSATLSELTSQTSTGLKRPIITPPRPSVQGSTNLQAGGTALIGRRPI